MIYSDLMGFRTVCTECGAHNSAQAEWCDVCLRDLDVARRTLGEPVAGTASQPTG